MQMFNVSTRYQNVSVKDEVELNSPYALSMHQITKGNNSLTELAPSP